MKPRDWVLSPNQKPLSSEGVKPLPSASDMIDVPPSMQASSASTPVAPSNAGTTRGALKGVGLCAPSGNLNSSFGSLSYTPQLALSSFGTYNAACPAMGGTTTYGYSDPSAGVPYVLKSESSSRLGGYSYNHTYDAGLNPTTLRGFAQSSSYRADDVPNNATASYDNVGNYQAGGIAHDAENRMVKGAPTGWAAGYRPDGLRAWKEVNGSRTWYLYDREGNPVVETDASGNPTAVNDFDPAGLVGRLSVASGAATYYQFDPQGNVAHALDASGNVLNSRLYDAYGQETVRDALGNAVTPADPFGFNAESGYYLDRETGASYCENRYYAPSQGRWLERDPLGIAGGMNLYGYCAAQPVGSADPEGTSDEQVVIRVLKFVGEHFRIPTRSVTEEEAVRLAQAGENLSVRGKTYQKEYRVGKDIAEKAYGKDNVTFHGAGDHSQPAGPARDHFQPTKRGPDGHIFIGGGSPGFLLPFLLCDLPSLLDNSPLGIGQDLGHAAVDVVAPYVEDKQKKRSAALHWWLEDE